jgi:preprotein translocase subunit SecE
VAGVWDDFARVGAPSRPFPVEGEGKGTRPVLTFRLAIRPHFLYEAVQARNREVPRREFFRAGESRRPWEVFGMTNPFEFIQQVRVEATKVVWPTRRETLITTGLVMLMAVFASVFFIVVDEALRVIVSLVLGFGRGG